MAETEAKTPRERYRAQVREEIKKHAWEQITTAGASALSLNAVAKQIGMSGPALYRYFANRDELITELIRDAFRSLADTFQARAAAGTDLTDLALTLRRWALADPQRYFLVFGTPVPGYHAPEDVTRTLAEVMTVLLDTCTAAPTPSPLPPSPLDAHLADHRAWAGDHPAPPTELHRALATWTRLHGLLSLELAGHFTGMGLDPAELYAAEVQALAHG
ncbi:TetR/AcrR family transcriptional regulator [Kitasatospora sp. NPDC002227]|uniref:TetR/AcrR family transcriptional regulator n=1 Tax=Kitasatospora sp. NPDC002227 TaxID=3154773 RepID=UPI00332A36DD